MKTTENYPDVLKKMKKFKLPQQKDPTQQVKIQNPQSFIHHPLLSNQNLNDYDVQLECINEVKKLLQQINKYKIVPKEQKVKSLFSLYIFLLDKDVGKCVDTHLDLAISYLAIQNHMKALEHLHEAEMIIQSYHQFGETLESCVYIQLLANYGIAFYKIGILDESYAQFIMALTLLKKEMAIIKTQNLLGKQIFFTFLQIQLQLQCGILLSEGKKHDQAFQHTRKAAKYSVKNCTNFIKLLIQSQDNKTTKKRSLSFQIRRVVQKIDDNKQNILMYALSQIVLIFRDDGIIFKKRFLENIFSQIPKEAFLQNNQKQDLFFQLLQDYSKRYEWVSRKSILQLLQLQPLAKSDLNEESQNLQNYEELIMLNICYCSLSLYAMSTEFRFIETQSNNYNIKDSEIFIAKSLEIVCSYYFHDSPLFKQIVEIYQEFHGIDKQVIPEDEEFSVQSKYIQCGSGVGSYSQRQKQSKFFIPLIRVKTNNLTVAARQESPKESKTFRNKKFISTNKNIVASPMIQFLGNQFETETTSKLQINIKIETEPDQKVNFKIRYLSPSNQVTGKMKTNIHHQRMKTSVI